MAPGGSRSSVRAGFTGLGVKYERDLPRLLHRCAVHECLQTVQGDRVAGFERVVHGGGAQWLKADEFDVWSHLAEVGA